VGPGAVRRQRLHVGVQLPCLFGADRVGGGDLFLVERRVLLPEHGGAEDVTPHLPAGPGQPQQEAPADGEPPAVVLKFALNRAAAAANLLHDAPAGIPDRQMIGRHRRPGDPELEGPT
jgi:hypothetical protein